MGLSKTLPHRGAREAVSFKTSWTCGARFSTITLQKQTSGSFKLKGCLNTKTSRPWNMLVIPQTSKQKHAPLDQEVHSQSHLLDLEDQLGQHHP